MFRTFEIENGDSGVSDLTEIRPDCHCHLRLAKVGCHATAAATTPLHELACRYLGLGSVVGITYLAAAGSTPVHMTRDDGGTGPRGGKYSRLDRFGHVVEPLWKMGSVVIQNAAYGYDRSSNCWDLVKRERDDTGNLDQKRCVLHDAIDPVVICNANGTVTQRLGRIVSSVTLN